MPPSPLKTSSGIGSRDTPERKAMSTWINWRTWPLTGCWGAREMRQVVLDTETTGLEVELQHRIIEIGCVELLNRRITGRHFHKYVNPERDIDQGAELFHGISRDK